MSTYRTAVWRSLIAIHNGNQSSVYPWTQTRLGEPYPKWLRIWRHLKPLLPIDMAEFASYYENTWIGTSTTNPNFAPHMWNQHEAAQMRIPRSSNIAEGWHHGFHSMLSCSKPTIWKFLDCLKAEQALTDVKKTKRDGRELPEPRAPKWIRYDRQLQRIVDDYDNYSNPMDFLKAIGNLTML